MTIIMYNTIFTNNFIHTSSIQKLTKYSHTDIHTKYIVTDIHTKYKYILTDLHTKYRFTYKIQSYRIQSYRFTYFALKESNSI